eukprot:10522601-Alexandrium_andersonii.AAC.1
MVYDLVAQLRQATARGGFAADIAQHCLDCWEELEVLARGPTDGEWALAESSQSPPPRLADTAGAAPQGTAPVASG